jgi:hypothetical protein
MVSLSFDRTDAADRSLKPGLVPVGRAAGAPDVPMVGTRRLPHDRRKQDRGTPANQREPELLGQRDPWKYAYRRPPPTAIMASGLAERLPMGTPGRRCRCDTRTDHAYQDPHGDPVTPLGLLWAERLTITLLPAFGITIGSLT